MNKKDKQLLERFRQLPAEAQQNLLDYADFLLQRYPPPLPLQEPREIPRPESESVIAAVKRLSETFPMLNKDRLLHETSSLVTQHLVKGRAAIEVIDELEIIFRRHYAALHNDGDTHA